MIQAAKRFYKKAEPAEVVGGYGIFLDGRPLRTPGRRDLMLPSWSLADALAAEWDAQAEQLDPEAMPLTALAFTARDIVAPKRSEVVDEIAAYSETDLLCYRASYPDRLVQRQQEIWQPLIDWVDSCFGAPLEVTTGIQVVEQPEESRLKLKEAVESYDDLALSSLSSAVSISSSLVIALALCEERLSPEEAFDAAELDETFEMECWGWDREAQERRDRLQGELRNARRFLDLLKA